MTPTHTCKKGRRYRYYISRETGRWRVPAADLERLVVMRLTAFLESQAELFGAIEKGITDATDRVVALNAGKTLEKTWDESAPPDQHNRLRALIDRVVLQPGLLEIRLCREALIAMLTDQSSASPTREHEATVGEATIVLTTPIDRKRAGVETRLIVQGADQEARQHPDRSLYRLIAQGFRYREMVLAGGKTISELAHEAGVGRSYFSRILRLGFLAPDIVMAILADAHPLELTANRLSDNTHLPVDWAAQKEMLGIA